MDALPPKIWRQATHTPPLPICQPQTQPKLQAQACPQSADEWPNRVRCTPFTHRFIQRCKGQALAASARLRLRIAITKAEKAPSRAIAAAASTQPHAVLRPNSITTNANVPPTLKAAMHHSLRLWGRRLGGSRATSSKWPKAKSRAILSRMNTCIRGAVRPCKSPTQAAITIKPMKANQDGQPRPPALEFMSRYSKPPPTTVIGKLTHCIQVPVRASCASGTQCN